MMPQKNETTPVQEILRKHDRNQSKQKKEQMQTRTKTLKYYKPFRETTFNRQKSTIKNKNRKHFEKQ